MNLLMKSYDLLILRDGHPFGDIGTVEGYSKQWPLPQTLTGMIRTQIGYAKSANYFDNEQNCKDIFNYGLKKQIPILANAIFLAPVPSDIVFSQQENAGDLTINIPILNKCDDSSGTDIENIDWLIPYLDLKDKPAKEPPFFLYWHIFEKYLNEGLNSAQGTLYKFGTSAPVSETRLHNAIDLETFTSNKGQLFSNKGIYLQVNIEKNKSEPVNLLLDIETNDENIEFTGEAYLGGERKTVSLQKSNIEFPQCPGFYKNKQYLKLILATHGDFGSWCPKWLMPDINANEIAWNTIPNTNYKIRLRSAYISGHDSVSGWDYVTRNPKPTKKLVLPGAVYVVELDNPAESQSIAELLWGNCLDITNSQTALNGYGQIFVGNITIK